MRVVPRASRSEIVGMVDGVLKVRIAAPPVDNAANVELIKLMAKILEISRSKIEIISGSTTRTKRLRIRGRDLQRKLGGIDG